MLLNNFRTLKLTLVIFSVFYVNSPIIHAAEPVEAATDDENSLTLNQQVQSLKEQVLDLNKNLFILEEELLYPSETQLAVYVSLDIGHYFNLDAVKLSVDGEVVSSYLYTARQIEALKRGGIQRLYLGNVRSGEHELVAVFTGLGPNGEDYRRATELTFVKDDEVKHIELKVIDSTAKQQPEFTVKEW